MDYEVQSVQDLEVGQRNLDRRCRKRLLDPTTKQVWC